MQHAIRQLCRGMPNRALVSTLLLLGVFSPVPLAAGTGAPEQVGPERTAAHSAPLDQTQVPPGQTRILRDEPGLLIWRVTDGRSITSEHILIAHNHPEFAAFQARWEAERRDAQRRRLPRQSPPIQPPQSPRSETRETPDGPAPLSLQLPSKSLLGEIDLLAPDASPDAHFPPWRHGQPLECPFGWAGYTDSILYNGNGAQEVDVILRWGSFVNRHYDAACPWSYCTWHLVENIERNPDVQVWAADLYWTSSAYFTGAGCF
jgi:hypothetical protein